MTTTQTEARQIHCDMCKDLCNTDGVYYDAKTIAGPWANLCGFCWSMHTTCSLGTGIGQQFMLVDGQWKKTAG